MIGVFRPSRVVAIAIYLALSALTFTLFAVDGHAQFKKGVNLPPNFDFGFVPGRKVFYKGVFRVDGDPKGKLEVLSQMVNPHEKSVVVYTRQMDDAIFKLIAALEENADSLKACPTHFVFLFADRESLAKKGGGFKKVSLLLSNKKTPRDWGIFDIDPKLETMVFLVEQGTIKTKFEVKEGMASDARMDELAKAILAYAAPLPASPLNVKDKLDGHSGGARSMAFSPDGKWLYSHGTQQDSGLDARIRKWELATGKQVADVASHGGGAYGIRLTRDGKTVLSVGHNTEVKVWDADLKLLDTIKLTATPFSLRISPDQKTFAVGGGTFGDNTIRIFHLSTRKEKFNLKGHIDRIRAIDYSPDSKLLVSGDEKSNVKLWDAVEGKEIAAWTGNTTVVEAIAFSPDGKWVASGGRELTGPFGMGRARLWNVETGKEVRELESTRVNGVRDIAFLGNKKLAICGDGNLIRVIDLTTGKEASELAGHRSLVLSLALSPDGAILASGEWHGPIRLWNWSGKEKK